MKYVSIRILLFLIGGSFEAVFIPSVWEVKELHCFI